MRRDLKFDRLAKPVWPRLHPFTATESQEDHPFERPRHGIFVRQTACYGAKLRVGQNPRFQTSLAISRWRRNN